MQDENDGRGSPVCLDLNWKKPKDCTNDQYLDDRFVNNPSSWNCTTCPEGGACNGLVTWSTLGPLFGWWKLPESERPSEQLMFTKCLYPPACLGFENPSLGEFLDEDGHDLALVGVISGVNAANTTCAIHLGFHKESVVSQMYFKLSKKRVRCFFFRIDFGFDSFDTIFVRTFF